MKRDLRTASILPQEFDQSFSQLNTRDFNLWRTWNIGQSQQYKISTLLHWFCVWGIPQCGSDFEQLAVELQGCKWLSFLSICFSTPNVFIFLFVCFFLFCFFWRPHFTRRTWQKKFSVWNDVSFVQLQLVRLIFFSHARLCARCHILGQDLGPQQHTSYQCEQNVASEPM